MRTNKRQQILHIINQHVDTTHILNMLQRIRTMLKLKLMHPTANVPQLIPRRSQHSLKIRALRLQRTRPRGNKPHDHAHNPRSRRNDDLPHSGSDHRSLVRGHTKAQRSRHDSSHSRRLSITEHAVRDQERLSSTKNAIQPRTPSTHRIRAGHTETDQSSNSATPQSSIRIIEQTKSYQENLNRTQRGINTATSLSSQVTDSVKRHGGTHFENRGME